MSKSKKKKRYNLFQNLKFVFRHIHSWDKWALPVYFAKTPLEIIYRLGTSYFAPIVIALVESGKSVGVILSVTIAISSVLALSAKYNQRFLAITRNKRQDISHRFDMMLGSKIMNMDFEILEGPYGKNKFQKAKNSLGNEGVYVFIDYFFELITAIVGFTSLPNFKQHDIQASSKWLKNHRDMWDGKKGHIKAVASLGVEHLGCTEWKDKDGKYQCTNPIDVELVYTANNAMDKVYYDSLEGRIMVRTVTVKGHNFLHFGEGQPPRNVGIPDISLVTAPDYLTAINETHQMEKFSLDLMCEQIETFLKMTLTLDKMSTNEIGKPEPYSLVLGKIK